MGRNVQQKIKGRPSYCLTLNMVDLFQKKREIALYLFHNTMTK